MIVSVSRWMTSPVTPIVVQKQKKRLVMESSNSSRAEDEVANLEAVTLD